MTSLKVLRPHGDADGRHRLERVVLVHHARHVVDHDDRHDAADRRAGGAALHTRSSAQPPDGTGINDPGRRVHFRLSGGMAWLQRGGDRAAGGDGARRPPRPHDDVDHRPHAHSRHFAGHRPLPAVAAQVGLSRPLPPAGRVPHPQLAQRDIGRRAHGPASRRLLRRLLLAADGVDVRWRRDEPDLDRRSDHSGAGRKARAARRPDRQGDRAAAHRGRGLRSARAGQRGADVQGLGAAIDTLLAFIDPRSQYTPRCPPPHAAPAKNSSSDAARRSRGRSGRHRSRICGRSRRTAAHWRPRSACAARRHGKPRNDPAPGAGRGRHRRRARSAPRLSRTARSCPGTAGHGTGKTP